MRHELVQYNSKVSLYFFNTFLKDPNKQGVHVRCQFCQPSLESEWTLTPHLTPWDFVYASLCLWQGNVYITYTPSTYLL